MKVIERQHNIMAQSLLQEKREEKRISNIDEEKKNERKKININAT